MIAEFSISDWGVVLGGLFTLLCLVGSAAWWCSAIYRDVHAMAVSLEKLSVMIADHERRLLKANL